MSGGIREVTLVFDLKCEVIEFIEKHIQLDQEKVAGNSIMIITEECPGEVNRRSPEKEMILSVCFVVFVIIETIIFGDNDV
jgi:hypothetical protein